MRYEVVTDENGYVDLIRHTGTVRDFVELDLDDYDLTGERMYAYRLGKDELIFDQTRWEEIQSEQQKIIDEARIKELKQNLADTDYITAKWAEQAMQKMNSSTFINDMIAINREFTIEYGTVIDQREAWREEIEQLEDETE